MPCLMHYCQQCETSHIGRRHFQHNTIINVSFPLWYHILAWQHNTPIAENCTINTTQHNTMVMSFLPSVYQTMALQIALSGGPVLPL